MDLNAAIIHCKNKAKELGNCVCSKEHEQLANWLIELKKFRKKYGKNCN